VQHPVQRTLDEDVVGDVVLDKLNLGFPARWAMLLTEPVTRLSIADHVMTIGKKAVGEVGTERTRRRR
jgi:hypothetical protein